MAEISCLLPEKCVIRHPEISASDQRAANRKTWTILKGLERMKKKTHHKGPLSPRNLAALSCGLFPIAAFAQITQDIRIVTFNTQADVSKPTPAGALPYLATVLEGIGQEKYVGDNILQLPDIIALQETTNNSTTVVPLASDLNTYYGSNIFATSTYQATTSDGDTDGGGPNGLIYNQNTMNLI